MYERYFYVVFGIVINNFVVGVVINVVIVGAVGIFFNITIVGVISFVMVGVVYNQSYSASYV